VWLLVLDVDAVGEIEFDSLLQIAFHSMSVPTFPTKMFLDLWIEVRISSHWTMVFYSELG
jgi:hypothetical protein